jgi:hypothetical protein
MTNTQEKQLLSRKSHPARVYHVDPFTFENGHFVGHDGFIVPKDFAEFHERFPQYVAKWVSKRLRWRASIAEVEDWTQELMMHLHSLPSGSKFRLAGKQDVVQTFDPVRMHGANEARFRYFINLCLANKFNTLYMRRKKKPMSNPKSLFIASVETNDQLVVFGEYSHEQSAQLRLVELQKSKQRDDELLLKEVLELADVCDPGLRMVMEAFRATGTWKETARLLHLRDTERRSIPERLRKLGSLLLRRNADIGTAGSHQRSSPEG